MTQPADAPPTSIGPADAPGQEDSRKLLSDLQGRWVGEGINTLWVPTPAGAPTPIPPPMYTPVPDQPAKPLPRFVSCRTTETIVVGDPLGSVPNKGPKDDFSELAAPYEQRAYDENGNMIHAENGFWLVTPGTQQPSAVASVAKLSSIPHGTVAIVQGPLPTGQTGVSPVPAPDAASVMPASSVPGLAKPTGPLAQEFIDNVASYVQQRITADRTGLLWELRLVSTGVANIDFLNANGPVKSVQSTFWIGNLGIRADGEGEQAASVLAYVQTALVTFDGIDWPHVSVGYLTKDMESRH
jgi:hypothetical protein